MSTIFKPYQLKSLLMSMAETAIERYMRENEPKKDLISQRQAYRHFGEEVVKRWEKENQLTIKRGWATKNSPKLYSKSEMNTILRAETLQMQNVRMDDI